MAYHFAFELTVVAERFVRAAVSRANRKQHIYHQFVSCYRFALDPLCQTETSEKMYRHVLNR